jgi:hypothetical protein
MMEPTDSILERPVWGKTVTVRTQPEDYVCLPRPRDCMRINESPKRQMGLEAESKMRVASLENVLAVATLVLAIVVVVWAIKLYLGA